MKNATNFSAQLEQISPAVAVVREGHQANSKPLVKIQAYDSTEQSRDCLHDLIKVCLAS